MRYVMLRSHSDLHLFLIYRDDGLADVPQQVRALGPWRAIGRGEFACLRMHYRMLLAEQSFILVFSPKAVLHVEA